MPLRRMGRPRRYCLSCRPSKPAGGWHGATAEEKAAFRARLEAGGAARDAERQVRAELAARLHLLLHVARLEAIADGRAARPADPRTDLCGCGRDYLTVPLEESHLCIRPISVR